MGNRKKLKIGSSIQTARVQKGLTQQELAEKIGLERNTIMRIETGKFYPRFETLLAILKELDLTLKIGNETIE